ncbi:hypothetical protein R4J03_06195 [Brachyspira intermedia]|uniref:radical SAM protein n=1 Tax=Brachyspira intermedia TaxID=84377 RepID=UPI0030075198
MLYNDSDLQKEALETFFSSKNIFITLTHYCNAFCQKCLTRYHKFRNQSITYEMLNCISDFIIKHDYNGTINIGSGEALTYKYLGDFVNKILTKNRNTKFRILTNGILLNKNLDNYYFDKRITWGVTFDGFTNDDLTDLQSGVDIEIVKKNISDLCQAGYNENIYLNYTLNKQNFKSLKEFIDFASKNNVRELYVTEMKIFCGFEKLEKFRFDSSKSSELFELEKYAKSLNFYKVYFATLFSSKPFDKCYNVEHVYPIIDIDGSLSFCYGQEDKILGNVFDNETIVKWYKLYLSLKDHTDAGKKWCTNCSTKYDGSPYLKVPLDVYTYLKNEN